MHGLMRGHQRHGDGWLERDTRLKREKQCLLTNPERYCAGVLLYNVKRLLRIEWATEQNAESIQVRYSKYKICFESIYKTELIVELPKKTFVETGTRSERVRRDENRKIIAVHGEELGF